MKFNSTKQVINRLNLIQQPIRYLHKTIVINSENDITDNKKLEDTKHKVKEELHSMLRVNQAGEIGANYIYMGQHFIFRNDKKLEPLIKHMWDQEKVHLETFNKLIGENRVRPTLLTPLWQGLGFALGATTAILGKEAAMACTEAVETVIGEHYNDQLRTLSPLNTEKMQDLKKVIKQFRDEELEHLDIAVEHEAKKAPMYEALNTVIQTGCKAAIYVASRV